jgi:hypothetical protein
MTRSVILDNEAVQALARVDNPKHRRTLAIVEAVASRNLLRSGSAQLVVPTAVRVEAGWDRTRPGAAVINRLRIGDRALDSSAANRGASLRSELGVSVADAHIGCILAEESSSVIVTSDPDDMSRIAAHLRLSPTIVLL